MERLKILVFTTLILSAATHSISYGSGPSSNWDTVDPKWAKLDFSHPIEGEGMVFYPLKGYPSANGYIKGVVYFTDYVLDYDISQALGDLNTIRLRLLPTAHQLKDSSGRIIPSSERPYVKFLKEHKLINEYPDLSWIPGYNPEAPDQYEACSLTPAALNIFQWGENRFGPKKTAVSFPFLCSFTATFLKEDRGKVIDLLKNDPILTSEVHIPRCKESSHFKDFGPLMEEMLRRNIVKSNGPSHLIGDLWASIFLSVQLMNEKPDLFDFKKGDMSENWSYVASQLFQVHPSENKVIIDMNNKNAVYLCEKDDPLVFTFPKRD